MKNHRALQSGRIERSKVPASHFTTAVVEPEKRFAAWQESVGVIFEVRQPQGADQMNFDASVESYLIEDIVFGRCSAGAQKFDRSALRFAQDSIDHYMIQLFVSGSVEMDYRGRSFRMNAGGLISFDFAEVMDTFNTDFDLLMAIIPRRRLASRFQHPDGLQGVTIDPDSGTGALLANYMTTLYKVAPSLRPAEASIAANSLVELAALAFNGATLERGDLPELAQHAQLTRVQAYILDHLSLPHLTPEMVSQGVAMSRASLYRLFAPIGGIAEYIREQRLRRCLADLLSARHANRSIADIAYGWGFRDSVYFAKVFKQRFGRTPSDAREAGQATRITLPASHITARA